MHIQMQSRTDYVQVRSSTVLRRRGAERRPTAVGPSQQHGAHSAAEQSDVPKDKSSVGESAHRESAGSETTPNLSGGTVCNQNMDGGLHEVITRGIPTLFNVL